MDKVIAANYLASLDKSLEQHALPGFLERIGFDMSRVHDPSAWLSADEFKTVINKAYELSGIKSLGLHVGKSLSIVTHGYLGYAAMSSPVLGSAIETMVRYLNTRTTLINPKLQMVNAEYAYVSLDCLASDRQVSTFMVEMALVHLVNMRRFLIKTEKPIPKVELIWPEPDYADEYKQLLGISVEFNKDANRVWFRTEEFDMPVFYADDASFQLAQQQLAQLATQMAQEADLPGKIKSLLVKQELMHSSMEDVASQLCMTSRTLRRHLQKHKLNWQDLVDEVRQKKAYAYLLNPGMSVTEIAYVLGFRDTSSFSKAFKRWTGMTPVEYRQSKALSSS